jgi:hypothetical protein
VFAELVGCAVQWQHALENWNMTKSKIIAQWRAEAAVEQARADLLCALQLRFQTQVPADLATAIRTMTDLDELSRWFRASQTAGSLKEFRAAVQKS